MRRAIAGLAIAAAAASVLAATPPDRPTRPTKLPAVVSDPYFSYQWGLQMVRAPEAWAYATGRGAVVAVIDTGIELEHEDLKGQTVPGRSWAGDGTVTDLNGHGTFMAGIIAARTNNGKGIAGVAPDARIMPLRLFAAQNTNGGDEVLRPGFHDDLAEAIRHAVDNGADIINMSFTTSVAPTLSLAGPQVQEALDHAWERGVVLVAAAGNYTMSDICDDVFHERVLCVGAVGANGDPATYTQPTSSPHLVLGPGGDVGASRHSYVVSTVNGSYVDTNAEGEPGRRYAVSAGTSAAAGFVAGVAALLVELGLTNEEIVERIEATADLVNPRGLWPTAHAGRTGHGVVNAFCAVTDNTGRYCEF